MVIYSHCVLVAYFPMHQSIIIADELRSYLPVLCRFLSGEQCGLKREKLRHSGTTPIYSLRLNKANRLLYTVAVVNDSKCVVVIGEILSHDYHKSRFLRAAGVLKQYLDNNKKLIEQALQSSIEENAYEPVGDNEPNGSETVIFGTVGKEYIPLKNFGAHLFFDDANQEACVTGKQANTVIVTGSTGTGKTVSAIRYLSSHAGSAYKEGELKRYLYVSSKRFLVENVQKQIEVSLSPNHFKCIEFKTYNDLVASELQNQKTIFMSREEVEAFIQTALNKRKKWTWSIFGGAKNMDEAIKVVHEEWILLSGLQGSWSRYQQLGNDQSYIKNEHPEIREWVCVQYDAFKKNQKATELYLPFHRLQKKGVHYDGLIVDEAFLLSFANISGLREQAGYFMLLGDSHQAIGAHWLSVFSSQQSRGVSYISLRENYRNPSSVIDVLNRVLQVKYYIRPGLRDKFEQSYISNDKPRINTPVLWVNEAWCQGNREIIKNWTDSSQFAVVVLCDETRATSDVIDKKKDAIRQRFNTPLVFTRQEIQGLEYAVIVVVIDSSIQLISDKLPRTFVNELRSAPTTRSEEKGVTYAQQQAMNFSSQLYVAFSRAQNQLVVYVDEEARALAPELLPFYETGFAAEKQLQQQSNNTLSLASATRDDWEEQQKLLENHGFYNIATQIREDLQKKAPFKQENKTVQSRVASEENRFTTITLDQDELKTAQETQNEEQMDQDFLKDDADEMATLGKHRINKIQQKSKNQRGFLFFSTQSTTSPIAVGIKPEKSHLCPSEIGLILIETRHQL